jgi:hypothetical protein
MRTSNQVTLGSDRTWSDNCIECDGREFVRASDLNPRSTLTCLMHHLYENFSGFRRITHFWQECDAGAAYAILGRLGFFIAFIPRRQSFAPKICY